MMGGVLFFTIRFHLHTGRIIFTGGHYAMPSRQKMIGICLSQAHSFLNTGFLSELADAVRPDGYSISVINSSLDFYWYQKNNLAPRAAYKAIPYDRLDAVIIIYHSFHDEELAEEIISSARKHHVPVICAGAKVPGCYSVLNDYEGCYKDLLRHVIRDHGARDTFFIAGMKNEPNSEERIRCYREVLEEEGLPFSADQVAYGNYWARPAGFITQQLIDRGGKLPRAVFCANDTMAISVCDTLKKNGLRIPEDVIVTGFDGMPAAYMVRPHLTTCSDDPGTLALQVRDLLRKLREGEQVPDTIIHSFRPVYAGSCGCPDCDNDRYDALTVYRRSEALNNHENDLYHKVERMLLQKDSESFLKMISASILPGSCICLNKRFLNIYSGIDYSSNRIEDDLLLIPYRERDEEMTMRSCSLRDFRLDDSRKPAMYVFNTIHTGTVVCGFFGARVTSLEEDAQLIKRLSDVLNLVFAIQLGNARQQLLVRHLNDSLYQDPVTGLNNLRGLTRWFEQYSAREESRRKSFALSVYSIHRYNYIYENYGMNETEDIVRLVGNRLMTANPDALMIARISEDQFVAVHTGENPDDIRKAVSRSTEDLLRQIESYNAISSRQYYVEINYGSTAMEPGWENATMENLIRLALGELYLNRMSSSGRGAVKTPVSSSEFYSAFNLLMEKNLFKFHFQPIVDAKTAQIYAYEALMRTDILINLSPLEILATASEYNRLYDVEKATFFGIMDRYVRDYSDFNGSKVFINTIPGHFLNEADCAEFIRQYESYLDCIVYELTEQNVIPEAELDRLKKLCKPGGAVQVAIDDYGTGHSNMVSVLHYSPQIIKIDRALISGIQNDRNKQLFVRNTVDFAHQNGIKALAEGVETVEELRIVIDSGIDLIQGFYTGRPTEKPVPAVNEAVRQEILSENLLLSRFNRNARVYTPGDGETVSLPDLASSQYAYLQIAGGSVTAVGNEKQSVDLVIRVADDACASLTLKNVNLKGVNEPVIQLGARSRLTLVLEGNSVLNRDGIRVPPAACLTLQGSGNLKIHNTRNYSVGIGSTCNDPFGTIVLDLEGSLDIQSSGDKVLCIGGGRSAGEGITLLRGSCRFTANGISAIGIGSITGDCRVMIREGAAVSVTVEGNDAIALGSLSGPSFIRSAGILNLTVNSERSTGIGSMSGQGDILLEGGSVSVTVHCDTGACIGTFNGEITSRIAGARVRIRGEGNKVAGLGSPEGACDTLIEGGDVQGEVFAGERMLLGNEHSRVVITGGNVCLFPENRTPVSPGGLPLHYRTPEGDHFEQSFRDSRSAWTYTADRNPEGQLGVWVLPES